MAAATEVLIDAELFLYPGHGIAQQLRDDIVREVVRGQEDPGKRERKLAVVVVAHPSSRMRRYSGAAVRRASSSAITAPLGHFVRAS